MATIVLVTEILAPKQRCFDLSRSIDLHKISTAESEEEAIAGVTSGLIGLNETVTWRARHFGIWFELTSKITAFQSPDYFIDEMHKGIFKSFIHKHEFISEGEKTIMKDEFAFESPLGLLGKLANKLVLKQYLTKFLLERNRIIKEYAEGENWKQLI